ncbi:MAG: arylsulfotransferase family protein, partial [Candidatus Dormibacteria bacterium]
QGNVQLLPGGDVVVGWGAGTYTSEFSRNGRIIFSAHFSGSASSYRAYRSPWLGQPPGRPAVAVRAQSGGRATVYVSWNGATQVAAWRVVGIGAAGSHSVLTTGRWDGFETAIALERPVARLMVQALGAGGQVLGESEPVAGD